jgi:UDP-N-acetylmuramate--alanine ligase
MVGIGGSGMRGLATLLALQGKTVSGSDLSPAAGEVGLQRLGIALAIGHRTEHVGQAEFLIASAAVSADNPELLEARRRRLPIMTHAQALGQLMASRIGVAVAGTHGKTTTSALLGLILEQCGMDPSVLVGAKVLNFDSSARLGRGQHLIVEADEYERRFLTLSPWLAVITSIEADHLDYFANLEEIVEVFRQFAGQIAPEGVVVTCADEPLLAEMELPARRVAYGFSPGAVWRLDGYKPLSSSGCRFSLAGPRGDATVALRLAGRHNALNAAGAIAAACELGVALPEAARAAANFRGTERRFQTVWQSGGIWLVDDYAHHPTAIRATLAAAREIHQGRLWVVFQPHTTNRLGQLLGAFTESFQGADLLTLLPVYIPSGRERGGRPITSHDLAAAIQHPPVHLAESLKAAEEQLLAELRPGDLAVVMGAGDVYRVSQTVARQLAQRSPAA